MALPRRSRFLQGLVKSPTASFCMKVEQFCRKPAQSPCTRRRFVLKRWNNMASALSPTLAALGGFMAATLIRRCPFPSSALILWTISSPQVRERFAGYPHFHVVKGSFGKPETVAALPEVEALFLFDILLHQVDPDWGVILGSLYAQGKGHRDVQSAMEGFGEDGAAAGTRTGSLPSQFSFRGRLRDFEGGCGSNLCEPRRAPRQIRAKRRGDAPDIWQWGTPIPISLA